MDNPDTWSDTFSRPLPFDGVENSSLSDDDFERARGLVYDKLGINLTKKKKVLLVNRLRKHIRTQGFDSIGEFITHVENDRSGKSLSDLADLISTNHTYFWRESAHFEFFQKTTLPWLDEQMKESGDNDLRIWCAAASTGEEPYTISLLMAEHFGNRYASIQAGLLATDISENALGTARKGIYPLDSIAKLPPSLKNRGFDKISTGDAKVKEAFQRDVTYRRFNLKNDIYPFRMPFHTIFCRNVMIYFDQPTRKHVVDRMFRCTAPGGYLFIGLSETLSAYTGGFEYVQPSTYRKPL